MHQSGNGGRHRRTPSISERLMLMDHNVGAFDSVSNASLMEVDARCRAQTRTGSTVGVTMHLKDVTNALTTSKELLKIINVEGLIMRYCIKNKVDGFIDVNNMLHFFMK